MHGPVTPVVLRTTYRMVTAFPAVLGVFQLAAWWKFDLYLQMRRQLRQNAKVLTPPKNSLVARVRALVGISSRRVLNPSGSSSGLMHPRRTGVRPEFELNSPTRRRALLVWLTAAADSALAWVRWVVVASWLAARRCWIGV